MESWGHTLTSVALFSRIRPAPLSFRQLFLDKALKSKGKKGGIIRKNLINRLISQGFSKAIKPLEFVINKELNFFFFSSVYFFFLLKKNSIDHVCASRKEFGSVIFISHSFIEILLSKLKLFFFLFFSSFVWFKMYILCLIKSVLGSPFLKRKDDGEFNEYKRESTFNFSEKWKF